jgi:hypothetical protein
LSTSRQIAPEAEGDLDARQELRVKRAVTFRPADLFETALADLDVPAASGAASWRKFGVGEKDALNALLPLLSGTLSAVDDGDLARGMGGCAARGDVGTVRKHIAAMDRFDPEAGSPIEGWPAARFRWVWSGAGSVRREPRRSARRSAPAGRRECEPLSPPDGPWTSRSRRRVTARFQLASPGMQVTVQTAPGTEKRRGSTSAKIVDDGG